MADANFRKVGDVRFVSNAGNVELILRTGTDQLIRSVSDGGVEATHPISHFQWPHDGAIQEAPAFGASRH